MNILTLIIKNQAEFIDFANEQINNYIAKDKYLKDKLTFFKHAKTGCISQTMILSQIGNSFLLNKKCNATDLKYSEIQEICGILGGN